KQKLALSCALIHRPTVLILDEPTTGVDAVSRQEFWQMLQRLRHEGITMLVSTPYMDEARLCDRVALIQGGRILRTDTPQAIEKSYPHSLFSIRHERMYDLLNHLRSGNETHSVFAFGDSLHFATKDESTTREDIARRLADIGFDNAVVEAVPAGIEDVFMELMQVPADT
ncbi:MAG: ABC transporter ATP-binding protein, partial [Rhodothermales bacterium]|nr:ABC transporter ATP-binding protein [Rhodothermales bacterium]